MVIGLVLGIGFSIMLEVLLLWLTSLNILQNIDPGLIISISIFLGVSSGLLFVVWKIKELLFGKILYIILWLMLATPLIIFFSLLPVAFLLNGFS